MAERGRVDIAGTTVYPDERWMQQIARNVTMEGCGALRDCRYLLHDRDTKYTQSFRAIIASGRVEPLVLPACTLVHTQGLDGLLHLYKRLEKRGRALLLCLLCAEAGWLILVNAWLRLERAYLKLRLFLRV